MGMSRVGQKRLVRDMFGLISRGWGIVIMSPFLCGLEYSSRLEAPAAERQAKDPAMMAVRTHQTRPYPLCPPGRTIPQEEELDPELSRIARVAGTW